MSNDHFSFAKKHKNILFVNIIFEYYIFQGKDLFNQTTVNKIYSMTTAKMTKIYE